MKKFLSFIFVAVVATSIDATPYKALFVEAEAVPSGAGLVYIESKSAEDDDYIFDRSNESDETAYFMWVGGENSNGADYPGCTGGIGIFEVLIQAYPEDDYEVVCLANTIKEDGNYTESDCYAVIHGQNQALGWTFDFDYSAITEMGVKISVNNVEHPQDGHSEDGPSRDEVFADFMAYASETPDAHVYVIFRKKGDELPKFVSEGGESVREAMMDADNNAATYTTSGQKVDQHYKGIVIRRGTKAIHR